MQPQALEYGVHLWRPNVLAVLPAAEALRHGSQEVGQVEGHGVALPVQILEHPKMERVIVALDEKGKYHLLHLVEYSCVSLSALFLV